MLENYWWEVFFVLCGQVCAFVPSSLAFILDVGPAGGVDDGASPTVCHKGRCHIVEGHARGGVVPFSNVAVFTASHGK